MPTLLWFRRDLRLRDLPPLLSAASDGDDVLACFVLDPRLEASSGRRRLQFLSDSLRELRDQLDGRLHVTRGRPEDRIPKIVKDIGASAVHVSEDFTPYGRRRDQRVRDALGDVPLEANRIAIPGVARPCHQGRRCAVQGVHAVLPPLARNGLARSG